MLVSASQVFMIAVSSVCFRLFHARSILFY